MKNNESLSYDSKVLRALSSLPEKMLRLHGTENTSEFVLYELCHENCFDIPKAAFFIENPDFHCVKGVAGFHKYEHSKDFSLWDDPEAFTQHMKHNPFNQKVRAVSVCTLSKPSSDDYLNDIAHQLDIRDAGFHRFSLKHGNHGLVMYDKHAVDIPDKEIFARGACFLGFCPVF